MNTVRRMRTACAIALAGLAMLAGTAGTARAQAVTRYLGSITAISGDTLTVKTDKGDCSKCEVPSTAQLKRIAPGQTDLSKAEALDFGSLAVGDRVLVNTRSRMRRAAHRRRPGSSPSSRPTSQKCSRRKPQQWAAGVHGLVKSVDAASGINHRERARRSDTKPVAVNTTQATTLKRYAQGSVTFDQAQPAPISGDSAWRSDFVLAGKKARTELRLRRNGVVSGSFLSIAGTRFSTDASGST